jgi:hypothetical protein
MTSTMDKATALSIAWTLSKPGKMPVHSTSLPAKDCRVGSRLAKVAGSTCHGCYALKGNYRFGNVKRAMQKRLDGITHPLWVDAMVWLIDDAGEDYFRWHDSGDIQSLDHLVKIVDVCKRTPNVQHWLPSRENRVVTLFQRLYGQFPPNLVTRLSAPMVDGDPPTKLGLPTSTVVTDDADRTCKAPDQGGKCLDCRDCWNPSVQNVAYGLH